MAVGERIGNQTAQEGQSLDQLGGALHEQQGHADWQQQINRPADEPPAFCDISPLCQALTNSGQDIWIISQQKGARKKRMPTMSIHDRPRAVRRPETKSMRTWTFFMKA